MCVTGPELDPGVFTVFIMGLPGESRSPMKLRTAL